jgi:cytochrome P450
LRLESPVQLTARIALNDTEIAGYPVSQGALVVVYVAAANRDPAVFADPNAFDIERDNAGKHLAFSGGRHFCLGAGSRRDTRVLHGWSTLPVALGPARSMATR